MSTPLGEKTGINLYIFLIFIIISICRYVKYIFLILDITKSYDIIIIEVNYEY